MRSGRGVNRMPSSIPCGKCVPGYWCFAPTHAFGSYSGTILGHTGNITNLSYIDGHAESANLRQLHEIGFTVVLTAAGDLLPSP